MLVCKRDGVVDRVGVLVGPRLRVPRVLRVPVARVDDRALPVVAEPLLLIGRRVVGVLVGRGRGLLHELDAACRGWERRGRGRRRCRRRRVGDLNRPAGRGRGAVTCGRQDAKHVAAVGERRRVELVAVAVEDVGCVALRPTKRSVHVELNLADRLARRRLPGGRPGEGRTVRDRGRDGQAGARRRCRRGDDLPGGRRSRAPPVPRCPDDHLVLADGETRVVLGADTAEEVPTVEAALDERGIAGRERDRRRCAGGRCRRLARDLDGRSPAPRRRGPRLCRCQGKSE